MHATTLKESYSIKHEDLFIHMKVFLVCFCVIPGVTALEMSCIWEHVVWNPVFLRWFLCIYETVVMMAKCSCSLPAEGANTKQTQLDPPVPLPTNFTTANKCLLCMK